MCDLQALLYGHLDRDVTHVQRVLLIRAVRLRRFMSPRSASGIFLFFFEENNVSKSILLKCHNALPTQMRIDISPRTYGLTLRIYHERTLDIQSGSIDLKTGLRQ